MQQVINEIIKHDIICIFRHQSPDGDALGSQFGLAKIIEENFPNKKVFTFGDKFIGLEKSFPESKMCSEDDMKNGLAIILDTANSERIDDARWKMCAKSVKIDHHPLIEEYANIEYVNSSKPATSQIIVEIANMANWKINSEAAKYLYIGIIMDTGRFMYRGTDKTTFESAITLLESGLNIQEVYGELHKRKLNEVRFNAYMQLNFIIEDSVAWIYVDKDTYEKYGLTSDEAKYFVNAMAGIEGVEVWIMFFDKEDFIRGSIRSKNIKINHVAEQFNGGGHELASGVKAKDCDEMNLIIAKIKEEIANGR